MKSRNHELVVKVRFDRPVTRAAALRALRNIEINAYATLWDELRDGWAAMKVKSVKTASNS